MNDFFTKIEILTMINKISFLFIPICLGLSMLESQNQF